MRWTPLRLFATVAAAAALALSAPLAASAHDTLDSSTPADGATIDSLDAVTLTFSEPVLALGEDQQSTAVQVRKGDRYFETACPALSDAVVSVPVALGEAGEYEVVWQVVSDDGHPVSGTYTFTYAPADGTAAAKGSATPACAGQASASSGGSDDGVLLGVAAGVVGLAAIGVVIAILVGRRRAPAPEETARTE